jgi:SAM-dependent methyltransferase
VARLPIFSGAALDVHASKVDDVGFDQFLTKLYETAVVLDGMRTTGTLRRFRRSLDIGSGPALHSRILRLLRTVESNEAIDIYDGRGRCSESLLQRHARTLQALYAGYRARKLLPASLRRTIPKLRRIEDKFPPGVEQFGYRPDERPYGAWFSAGPSIDRYHVGDVFQLEGQYDLVTSFMAFDYFVFREAVAKVAALLAPGGIFAFIVSHWWYPINNTLLYGRFPYLLQQLGTDEALAYYRSAHPELPIEGIAQRRPTIADFERIGHAHGLLPRATIRLHPNHVQNPRSVLGPLAIDSRAPWSLERVLGNAQRVNPSVTLADLMTSHVMVLFEKR